MIIELNFIMTKEGQKLNSGDVWNKITISPSKPPVNFKLINITSMSNWFIVVVEFPDMIKIDNDIIDTLAGYITFLTEGNIKYRHYEIHGVTRSLVYHKEWEKANYE